MREAWLRHWRFYQRWHRYSVDGFEHLTGGPPALVVGYHGRSVARDLCMLTVRVHDRLGYLPHAFFHRGFAELPVLRSLLEGVEGLTGDAASVRAALDRGHHLFVTPGGTQEGCRPYSPRYRIRWEGTGYLKIALKHRLDVIPVVASGVDDTYIGLNNGHEWGERLGMPAGLPAWLGVGVAGLWPLSPPFRVRISQYIGPRIQLPRPVRSDPTALPRLHARMVAWMQQQLDHACAGEKPFDRVFAG